MTKTAIKFSTTDNLYAEFTIEVDSTEVERVKRLLEHALSDYRTASNKRDMANRHRRQVDAQRERTAERTRLRHALKRAGITVRNADDYRSGNASLESGKSYSEDTTNGWLRLSESKYYTLLDMVAKLGKQNEVEWELRKEKNWLSDNPTDVLYVRMPERIEL